MIKYHVGVDVGKERHHISVRVLSKDTYCKAFSISNDRDGFTEFISSLQKLSVDKSDFLIGIEACPYGINLSYFLMGMGFALVEVNPFRVGQFRKAEGKKAKTDRIDARSIAAILSLDNHKSLSIPDPVMDNLKELTRLRTNLVQERATAIIHLKEALSTLFPEFSRVFRQVDSAASLALLVAYPGPEPIIHAGEENIAATLSLASPHRMGIGMARRIVEAAQGTIGVMQRQPAFGIRISILAKRILNLQSTVKELDEQITLLFNSLPYKPQDFPMGQAPSIAAIVSEIGDIQRFPTLKKFLSHLGWCPSSFQTGNYRQEHPKMSHAGNRYIRRLIWMLSISAIKRLPSCREYFRRRVQEGKAKMHILVAVGRKLLSMLYAILKRGVRYDPNWEENSRLALAKR